jgi:hypothetical protein
MFSLKKFLMCCAIAVLAGNLASAQESPQPPTYSQYQLYQQFLARLLKINQEIAALTQKIAYYELVAAMNPDDPFLQYDLQILWMQLGMLQIEQTEVRLALDTLTP